MTSTSQDAAVPTRIAATVVSYNRRDLLRRTLASLQAQTRAVDLVIVVDNGSSDGAVEMMRNEFPHVAVFQTSRNLGGAGGFAWGIELAAALGYDAAWVMDDDAFPMPDALERSVGDESLMSKSGVGFVASIPVTEDLELGSSNYPTTEGSFPKQFSAARRGYLAVKRATFVGALVNLHRAKHVGLPNPDFFIWGDDTDFTGRLSHRYGAMARLDSFIVHESPAMHAMATRQGVGWKYRYLVRNSLWQMRWTPDSWNRVDKFRQALHASAVEVRYSTSRGAAIRVTAKSWLEGLFAQQNAYPFGSLLAADERARRWVEGRQGGESHQQSG